MKFSARESQVLELLQRGLTNKEIGQSLGVSPHTVRDYVSNMMRRYDLKTRTALVALTSAAYQERSMQERRATDGDRRSSLTAPPPV
jgi:DNA-binding NarL/FixJ family response regulator